MFASQALVPFLIMWGLVLLLVVELVKKMQDDEIPTIFAGIFCFGYALVAGEFVIENFAAISIPVFILCLMLSVAALMVSLSMSVTAAKIFVMRRKKMSEAL